MGRSFVFDWLGVRVTSIEDCGIFALWISLCIRHRVTMATAAKGAIGG